MIWNSILYFYMLMAYNSENKYQKAEMQANLVMSMQHQDMDTFSTCNDRFKTFILKDSIINKPGSIGTEYNYPIYKFETQIVYYKNMKIASIETKTIKLKRYADHGVTTGIQIMASLDSSQTYYFDQEQKLITRTQLLALQTKICDEKEKDKGN